ncbi:sugar kinase [Bifidobacterium sp. DSM 109958]|uniref:Sugar kinase n=1 Tax=Bifidobacterium moraviense TaxID=2675323 RepID=A0A7Y0F2N9_9BIFI|nr:PfkB family carbohydrate kinase [Bifidobacterium sp. DSM 109958]NMN00888.1 sugar kinase [Bifidobacterium sp. DSM 109958]
MAANTTDNRNGTVISLSEVVPDIMLGVGQVPAQGGYAVAGAPKVSIAAGYRVMRAARRMGAPVSHAGILGNGPLASMIHLAFDEAGIAHIGQDRIDEDSGFRIMLTDDAGVKTMIAAYGAEAHGEGDCFAAVEPQAGDVVHISGNTLTNQTAEGLGEFLGRASCAPRERRFDIVLNPTSALQQVSDQLLETLTLARPIWSCNRRQADVLALRLGVQPTDARRITVGGDIDDAMDDLCLRLSDVLGASLVIRCGAKGAWVVDRTAEKRGTRHEVTHVAAIPARGSHTRSAGSCHTGVVCARLAAGDGLVDAVRLANAAATIAIDRSENGVPSCPPYADAVALLRKADA